MKKFEINLPKNTITNKVAALFEKAVTKATLTIKSKGTLKSIPNSIHWHITNTGSKGTLEATFDTMRKRLWLSYHDNRFGDWIADAIVKIKKNLESKKA